MSLNFCFIEPRAERIRPWALGDSGSAPGGFEPDASCEVGLDTLRGRGVSGLGGSELGINDAKGGVPGVGGFDPEPAAGTLDPPISKETPSSDPGDFSDVGDTGVFGATSRRSPSGLVGCLPATPNLCVGELQTEGGEDARTLPSSSRPSRSASVQDFTVFRLSLIQCGPSCS